MKNELHLKALAAAKNFKEAERALQEVLREIDEKRVYYDLGFRSLMDYATTGLGLTPDVAYNHCTVARKSQELPEVRKAVADGVLTVAAVRHMAPVLTRENELEMVKLASRLTQTELRREVARRAPEQSEAPEKVRYVREDRLALELRVSEELMKKLRRAQNLASQSLGKLASLEETLEVMAGVFLDKRDPIKKAERASVRIIRKSEANPLKSGRAPIPAREKHEVTLRLEGRCSHRDSQGKRCTQTSWLHFHHLKPVSEGGQNRADNLTLLCSGHHRMLHRIQPHQEQLKSKTVSSILKK